MSVLVYSSRTSNPDHARMVEVIHSAGFRLPEAACTQAIPAPHLWGEFPMDCHACHMAVNS